MSIIEKFEETKGIVRKANRHLGGLIKELQEMQEANKERLEKALELSRVSQFNEEELKGFLKEPYVILPTKRPEEWWVIVPKFIQMQVGWLERSTESYNIFKVNKFINWLGDIPALLKGKFKFKPELPIKVYDGMVLTGKKHQKETWGRYSKFLLRKEGVDRIRVKRGAEFRLIAQIIDDGTLPFLPKEVEKADLRPARVGFELRDYQEAARQEFLKYGAIGVYWAYSAGKTYLGLQLCSELKGKKLIVVPTITLREQWEKRLRELTDIADEVEVITYYAFDKVKKKEYTLVIFDECHHLPANTFSRLSTLRTKYRLGLSATPYREDGRTDYIFALTGFPVGLDWEALIKLGVIEKPDIKLYILQDRRAKLEKLSELLIDRKKTIVFCDSIKFGNELSKRFEIPFVSGETSKRLEIIEEAETCIVSRVGDEGLSVKDIERIIEIDFLFGSRRQEGQRMGRLFHGKGKGEHIIIMSQREYESHSKRLYSIYEKGFKIQIIR